jgi:hypothetical protein
LRQDSVAIKRRAVEWLSFGALPLGLVFFAGTALGVVRRRAGHVRARADYPALARELGLEYRSSRYATGVGSLVGSIDGYRLLVDPDDQRRILLSWTAPPGLILHQRADTRRPPPGYAALRLRQEGAQAFFRTSLATKAGVEALGDGAALERFVLALAGLRGLKDTSITDAGITLSFDFGNPPFIPVQVVRHVVPAMVGLARTWSPR